MDEKNVCPVKMRTGEHFADCDDPWHNTNRSGWLNTPPATTAVPEQSLEASVWHLLIRPGANRCGADTPNIAATEMLAHVSCVPCLFAELTLLRAQLSDLARALTTCPDCISSTLLNTRVANAPLLCLVHAERAASLVAEHFTPDAAGSDAR